MKTTAITAIFALLGGVATAQTPAPFKQHLAAPVQIDSLRTINNTVQVTEHGRAADLIKAAEGNERRSVGGYRIVIFMSNTPTRHSSWSLPTTRQADSYWAKDNIPSTFRLYVTST